MDWFRRYTDYQEIEVDSAFERKYHPWGDEKNPERTTHQWSFKMRNPGMGIDESVNFERGQDPKKTMEIGRAGKVNYFRDNLRGYPYKKVIERDGPWPWGDGWRILKKAAEMLDIPEADVQIAVEYENEPLTTARIEEHIDDHEWTYDQDDVAGQFDLIKTATGEIYVFEQGEQEDPYMILGSPF